MGSRSRASLPLKPRPWRPPGKSRSVLHTPDTATLREWASPAWGGSVWAEEPWWFQLPLRDLRGGVLSRLVHSCPAPLTSKAWQRVHWGVRAHPAQSALALCPER